jgi:hypothetical protein
MIVSMGPKNVKFYAGAVLVCVALIIIGLWLRRRAQSKYTYNDIKAGTGPPETTVSSNIVSCQSEYNTRNATATTDAERTTLLNTFNECVRSNVSGYVDFKCKWVNLDATAANNASATEQSAFNQYTTDTNAVQGAYADLFTRTTDPAATNILNAALKADLTGATRRYLSTVCSGYFKSNVNGTVSDPSTTFSGWTVKTAGAGTTAPTTYSFWAGTTGKITQAAVDTWAAKAASYTVNANDDFVVGAPLATTSTYNANSTIANPAGGFYQNWEVALNNGPGTYIPQM